MQDLTLLYAFYLLHLTENVLLSFVWAQVCTCTSNYVFVDAH